MHLPICYRVTSPVKTELCEYNWPVSNHKQSAQSTTQGIDVLVQDCSKLAHCSYCSLALSHRSNVTDL